MKRVLLAAAGVMTVLAAVTPAVNWGRQNKKEVVALTPEQVPRFTPSYYLNNTSSYENGSSK